MADLNSASPAMAVPAVSPIMQIVQSGGQPPVLPPQNDDAEQEPSDSRKAFVAKLIKKVKSAKNHWEKKPNGYKQMRANMKFAEGFHYKGQRDDDDRMIIDIVQQHINTRTAALYARNPTIACQRRPRLEFKLWDGRADSLKQLFMRLQSTAQTGALPTPADQALMLDIQQGMMRRKLIEKVAKTAEILVGHSIDQQDPAFKEQCKQLVPRVLTCGVGYIRIDYQRELQKRPETLEALNDITSQLATLQRLREELAEGEIDSYSADFEQAMQLRAELQKEPDVVVRQGIVYSFPSATAIIPDKKCRSLVGFVGSDWVAQEHPMTEDDIEESFQKDVGGTATPYTVDPAGNMRANRTAGDDPDENYFCVWEIIHKKDGLVYWVCDGYDDFLQEPAPPNVKTKGFWVHRPLQFNRQETEGNPFVKSDVKRLMSLQKEINRTMEALRQHRIAARPLYVGRTGYLDNSDKTSLSDHAAHDVIELSVPPDVKLEEAITQLKKAAIDPNIYTLEPYFDAFQRVSGSSEANLGGTSGASATESSIAEASRVSSLESNKDDMDDMLTGTADDSYAVHMAETDVQTAMKIAGPGAVWANVPQQDIVEELYMKVRAGSSGRPNRDRQLAALERIGPILIQLPGVKIDWLVETYMQALDEGWDLVDVYDPSLPSVIAQNANAQPSTGSPATDPNQQGPAGADNAPAGPGARGGPQPSYQQLPSPGAPGAPTDAAPPAPAPTGPPGG